VTLAPTFSLDELNRMAPSAISAVLADVFEHAPEVAVAAAARAPFDTVTALHSAMLDEIAGWPSDQVLRFLNNHPDLTGPGERRPDLTPDSSREQAGAGLDRLHPEQAQLLAAWNREYRARFGFPFIICAARHSRDSILAEFARRRHGDPATERLTALAEISRITALRLVRKVEGRGAPNAHGQLSTHLLDTATGRPAAGITIALYLMAEGGSEFVTGSVSNMDGRTDTPLIAGRPIPNGTWELRFELGQYLSGQSPTPLLGMVPIRFTTSEPEAHYHIPLLFTPWSYTTYRGS